MNRAITSLRPSASLEIPAARYLSNGRLRSAIGADGGGCVWFDWMAMTAWDAARPGLLPGWSLWWRDLAGGGPKRFADGTAVSIDMPDARARWRRDFDEISIDLEALVLPTSHLEMRRITVRNQGDRPKQIELSAVAEVALHHPVGHATHPAFSKLFLQTGFDATRDALLVHRRPRASAESWPCLVCAMHGEGELQYETDRYRFQGRGWKRDLPKAIGEASALSGTVGNVLDPILATRRVLRIPAGGSASVMTYLGTGANRDEALALLDHAPSFEDATAQSASHSLVRLARLGISQNDALDHEALLVAMLRGTRSLRANPETIAAATGQAGGLGLDGERPFAVVVSDNITSDPAVAYLTAAQHLWADLGSDTAVVVIAPGLEAIGEAGAGLIHRAIESLPSAELHTLLASAQLVAGSGSAPYAAPLPQARHKSISSSPSGKPAPHPIVTESGKETLLFENGYGGFSEDGREYVIRIQSGPSNVELPPLPWINVLANANFGCLISETGAGPTWCRNSSQHRLTRWSNDPLHDPHGEAFYIRDESGNEVWSPLPGPRPARGAYEVRHGFGTSTFLHRSHGLRQKTTVFVAADDPVKLVRIHLTNESAISRRLSVFSWQELLIGTPPAGAARFITTSRDTKNRVLLANNRLGGVFSDGIAFASASANTPHAWHATGDGESFLGPDADPRQPATPLHGGTCDNRFGAGLDACFAQQITLELPANGACEIIFLFGEVTSEARAHELAGKYDTPAKADAGMASVRDFWTDLVSGIQVETPSMEINLMVNGWLAYQNLACRLWGRTAFYQSSGAYGFRDQLQDTDALALLRPSITRQQILLNAGQQYVEGDVQHWWHPAPIRRGLRTRFSDDLNWLPLVASHYAETTGDTAIFDEITPFLKAPLLDPGEDERYLPSEPSGESASVYEHCCRALDRSLATGAHGLPLMGCGDWNDGMSRVGHDGTGESVWMGFFLYYIFGNFIPVCEARGDMDRARRYAGQRAALRHALNTQGWDGEWYRRAYYDNGTPLGSKESDECKIDTLAQSWPVISGAGTPDKIKMALDSMEKHLISDKDGIIHLLDPPFVNTAQDPGYIKGYVAGVRENGGQYTHAACWAVRALAEAGRHDRATRLLEMLTPVSHTATRELTDRYKVEPYVVVADIYGAAPHIGRGGWSWYTGSAGWLFRVAVESVLGLRVEGGNTLVLTPRTPASWPVYRITYRHPGQSSKMTILVESHGGSMVTSATLDEMPLACDKDSVRIPLAFDGRDHHVVIRREALPPVSSSHVPQG
jgi:cellobiose phosphorylase